MGEMDRESLYETITSEWWKEPAVGRVKLLVDQLLLLLSLHWRAVQPASV